MAPLRSTAGHYIFAMRLGEEKKKKKKIEERNYRAKI